MSKGPWRSAIDRALGRSDVKESGIGRGRHDNHDHGVHINDLGITDRQAEILEAYTRNGNSPKKAAAELGITKSAIYDAIEDIAQRWGLEDNSAEAVRDTYYDMLADNVTATPADESYDADDATETGGNHPWGGYWDDDGNYVAYY